MNAFVQIYYAYKVCYTRSLVSRWLLIADGRRCQIVSDSSAPDAAPPASAPGSVQFLLLSRSRAKPFVRPWGLVQIQVQVGCLCRAMQGARGRRGFHFGGCIAERRKTDPGYGAHAPIEESELGEVAVRVLGGHASERTQTGLEIPRPARLHARARYPACSPASRVSGPYTVSALMPLVRPLEERLVCLSTRFCDRAKCFGVYF